MLKQRNFNEMVSYILEKIKDMSISEDAKKKLFAYITSLESRYFMEMGEKQQWIPCSERLPEEDRAYLVTNSQWGYPMLGITYWLTDGWQTKGEPIAWMPLPEPWKGDTDA